MTTRFRLKSLAAVSAERGSAEKYNQVGDVYSRKKELMLRCEEAAENLSLTLHLPRNSDVDLKAESQLFHNIPGSTPLLVHASYRMQSQ